MSWWAKIIPAALTRATSTKPAREANLEAVATIAAPAPAGPAPAPAELAARLLAAAMPTMPVNPTLAELDNLGVALGQVIDVVREKRRELRERADALRAAVEADLTAARNAREARERELRGE